MTTSAKIMNTEPLIRVTVCVNRKPGTTEAEFNHYWAYQHGPLALEWLLRCGIVRYVQVRPPTVDSILTFVSHGPPLTAD